MIFSSSALAMAGVSVSTTRSARDLFKSIKIVIFSDSVLDFCSGALKMLCASAMAFGVSSCGVKNSPDVLSLKVDAELFEAETRYVWPLVLRDGYFLCSEEGVLFETRAGGWYALSYQGAAIYPSYRDLTVPTKDDAATVTMARSANHLPTYGLNKCIEERRSRR